MKLIFLFALFFTSCQYAQNTVLDKGETVSKNAGKEIRINASGMTIATRFKEPAGFERVKDIAGTGFAAYLRNLALHPSGKKVKLYNGSLKGNQDAQAAVIRMDVGTQDLQQCADAVMRLRAEYLYKEKRYEELHFNFTNGFNAKYSMWRKGKGISVNGNQVRWVTSSRSNGSYESYRKYMNKVFMYAGTASLEKELKPKDIKNIEPGDVFIKGGHPGHAVIVVDVAINGKGDKVFMLAQSYMPAQEIHILKNPNSQMLSPWYQVSEIGQFVETPEWTFDSKQLRTFQ